MVAAESLSAETKWNKKTLFFTKKKKRQSGGTATVVGVPTVADMILSATVGN